MRMAQLSGCENTLPYPVTYVILVEVTPLPLRKESALLLQTDRVQKQLSSCPCPRQRTQDEEK